MRRGLTGGIRGTRAMVSDDVLLASLGIDVEEVRRGAPEVFGPRAVQRAALLAIEDGLAGELLLCMGVDVPRVRDALGS